MKIQLFKKRLIPDLLRNNIFRKLWLGNLTSIFGRRFTDLVLPLIILQNTGSPWKASIVFVGEQIAPILLAIPIGVLVESLPKKKVAIIANFVRFLGMIFLAFLVLVDGLSVWTVFVTLLITGTASEFFAASYTPFLVFAVGRERLEEAYNLNEGADAIGTLVGPAVAGGIFVLFGAAWALAIDALSILVSLVIIGLVNVHEYLPTKTHEYKNSKAKVLHYIMQGKEGILYIAKSKIQRLFVGIEGLLGFISMSSSLLIIILAEEALQLAADQTGLLFSAMGIGNIVGVLVLGQLHKIRWPILLFSSLLVSTIGALLLAFAPSFSWAMAGTFFLDGGLAIAFVVNASNHMIYTPEHLLARVDTTTSTIDGFSRLGARPYAGGLAQVLGAPWTFVISAILLAVGSITVFKNIKTANEQKKPELF